MTESRWGFGFAKGDAEWSKSEDIRTSWERIEDLMKERGLLQKDLADGAGVVNATITNIKKGDITSIRAETLVRLALFLDVSTDWLLGLTSVGNKTKDELVKQFADKTGYSSRAIQALLGNDAIDHHYEGYDYEYGGVLGYILDKSVDDKKSFLWYLNAAKILAYCERNGIRDEKTVIGWKNDSIGLSGEDAIYFLVKMAVSKFEALANEYIQRELHKPPIPEPDESNNDEEETED